MSGRDVPGAWWKLFNSPQIDAFVAEAIRKHPDLQAAQLALRQAREQVLAQQGSLLPQVSVNGSGNREQSTSAQGGSWPGQTSIYSLYSTSVGVSYALDLWGGTRRQIESLEAQAEYQAFKLEASHLTLSANVVTAAISDASLRAQIAATRDIIKAESDQLARLQHQFSLGAISKADVLAQESNLAQARATLSPLQKQLAQTRNQLMTYLGRFPNEDRDEHVTLEQLRLPQKLPVSVPSDLVRQRPDIRMAEASLHQATAAVGVSVSNLLPQMSLTANGGATGPMQLFSPGTLFWTLTSTVGQKLIDGGALYHTKEASVAAFEQNVALYKSTVLIAFQNVADSLRAVEYDAAVLKDQAAAEKATSESLQMAIDQFHMGAISYANVINAQQSYLTARIARIKAQAARHLDTAALLQSLGGGWWNRKDVSPLSLPRERPGLFTGPISKEESR